MSRNTYSHLPVFGLELLQCRKVVIDKAESVGKATTELGSESVEDDVLGVSLVHLGDLLTQFSLGHISATVMDDFNNLTRK